MNKFWRTKIWGWYAKIIFAYRVRKNISSRTTERFTGYVKFTSKKLYGYVYSCAEKNCVLGKQKCRGYDYWYAEMFFWCLVRKFRGYVCSATLRNMLIFKEAHFTTLKRQDDKLTCNFLVNTIRYNKPTVCSLRRVNSTCRIWSGRHLAVLASAPRIQADPPRGRSAKLARQEIPRRSTTLLHTSTISQRI